MGNQGIFNTKIEEHKIHKWIYCLCSKPIFFIEDLRNLFYQKTFDFKCTLSSYFFLNFWTTILRNIKGGKSLNKLCYENDSPAEKEREVLSTKFRNILSLYLQSLWYTLTLHGQKYVFLYLIEIGLPFPKSFSVLVSLKICGLDYPNVFYVSMLCSRVYRWTTVSQSTPLCCTLFTHTLSLSLAFCPTLLVVMHQSHIKLTTEVLWFT